MKKILFRLLAVLIALVTVKANGAATELDNYVVACKAALGLSADAILPAPNCNSGVRFAGGQGGLGLLNDYVGNQRISNYVDLTFACRWMAQGTNTTGPGPFSTAASLELMIHNRQNGNTCFFAAKDTNGSKKDGVSAAMVSLTDANASSYWMQPSDLNSLVPNTGTGGSTLKCVGCHVSGPYIASPRIAPYLAQFGLLNNGHVTSNVGYHAVKSEDKTSAFYNWDSIKDGLAGSGGCSNGCHVVGSVNASPCPAGLVSCPVPGIAGALGQSLVPALFTDIKNVADAGVMLVNGPAGPFGPAGVSDYRWMNIDIPDDANTTGDVEVFYDLKANSVGFTPTLNKSLTCETEPAYMEARLVGSATTYKSNEYTAATVGFPDKLERFDQTGLICRNAAQSSGMCSNYVVRFICLQPQLSVYNHWSGRVLTIANPDANQIRWMKGQPLTPAWYGSQTWHIEGLNDGSTNYSYVRFRNDWSGMYLNADDTTSVTADSKSVTVAYFRDWWLSEQWVMEAVPGTHYVRFRSLWKTGLYLTMVESSDYSVVNLQPLHKDASGNPNWTSQEWELK